MYIKTFLHYLSSEFAVSHVVSASMLLGRALYESLWSIEDWSDWCAEQHTAGVPKKAVLHLAKSKQTETKLVKQWIKKSRRPYKPGVLKRHVTPLSAKRIHTSRTAGVKRPSCD